MSGTSQPTSTALLEELRQRIRSEYAPPEPTSAERLATFGRGVLSNRGSFLDNLTAGIAAQDQAAEARANRQRLALDMERQVVENAVREQLERDRLAQSASQFEAEGPTREARIRSYNAQAAQAGRPDPGTIVGTQEGTGYAIRLNRDGTTTVLTGVFPTQAANLATRAEAAREALAIRAGNAAVAAAQRAAVTELSAEQIDRIFQDAYRRSLNPTQSGGAGTATTGGGQPGQARPVIRENFVPPNERR
jgi:hypothetical protein